MRIVFATFSERTHFLGLVPLAWALRAAGHEVLVASQPELGPVVRATGLPFAQVGRDHILARIIALQSRLPSDPSAFAMVDAARVPPPTPEALHSAYGDYFVPWWWRPINDPMVDDLVALCRSWRPDLVVWEPITYAGPIAAEACGARHLRHLWSLDLFAAMRRLFLDGVSEESGEGRSDPLRAWLTERAERHGVDFTERLVTGWASIDYLPPSLDTPLPGRTERVPLRYVPYNGRAVVPDWLRTPRSRPRVCVLLGTAAIQRMGDHAQVMGTMLEGLADLDAEIVASVPADRQRDLGPLPPNARLVDYAPAHALAPVSDAMITHGGTGTILSGLVHGVPQITIPGDVYDEGLVASALEKAGVGLSVSTGSFSAWTVGEAVREIFAQERYAAAGARLSEEIAAMPAPATVARDLVRPRVD